MWARVLLLGSGIVLNGIAGGLYIGSQLGPGPRDGLMTGFARRTGLSIRLVRTTIEVVVLSVGWLLGGPVGLGTVLYAVSIGPLVQFFLPRLTVDLGRGAVRVEEDDAAPVSRRRRWARRRADGQASPRRQECSTLQPPGSYHARSSRSARQCAGTCAPTRPRVDVLGDVVGKGVERQVRDDVTEPAGIRRALREGGPEPRGEVGEGLRRLGQEVHDAVGKGVELRRA